MLRHTGFPAASLELDLTESALATDPESALQAIKALRRLGVGVVLDDFGAGPTSLALLRRFPFTGVKIDRSLIIHLPRNRGDAALVAGLVQMARALGLDVMAEGVETEAQRRYVAEQGKLCAPAMDPRHVQHWVRQGGVPMLVERRAANQP